MTIWVVLGALAVLAIAIVFMYNGLIRAKIRVDEAWSDIDVQLKRRYDLIPNLVETVKGYAKHEKDLLEKVTELRTKAMKTDNLQEKSKTENMLSETLKSIFAVSENYPDLKANQNFLELQRDLTDTEDKIQASRRFYNGNVRDYNTKIAVFPTNIFAGMMNFSAREFFEAEEGEKEPVAVKF